MRSLFKLCVVTAGFTTLVSTASADLINIQVGAAATTIGPNLTEFDTLSSTGGNLSADLVPGVAQTFAFYALDFTPACNAAVCNGTFTRGLNFGFASAQDLTVPGNGSSPYVQPVRDSIASANTANSSHTLSISTGGGFVIDLGNGERLTITVPVQTFPGVATGDVAQIDSVSASFLLTAAPIPEPTIRWTMLTALTILVIARRRFFWF